MATKKHIYTDDNKHLYGRYKKTVEDTYSDAVSLLDSIEDCPPCGVTECHLNKDSKCQDEDEYRDCEDNHGVVI